MKGVCALLAAVLCLGLATIACADRVQLQEGTLYEGQIMGVSSHHLGFRNGIYGYFPWSQVAWVETADSVWIQELQANAPDKLRTPGSMATTSEAAEPPEPPSEAAEAPAVSGRLYQGATFSITFADDWEITEKFLGGVVMGLSPIESASDEFRENINVVIEELEGAFDAETYGEAAEAGLAKLMTDFDLRESEPATLDGVQAWRLVYFHRMGILDLEVLQYVTVHQGHGYVVTATATPETYEEFVDQFEQIIATFRFR